MVPMMVVVAVPVRTAARPVVVVVVVVAFLVWAASADCQLPVVAAAGSTRAAGPSAKS
jgi:hypothetical protein